MTFADLAKRERDLLNILKSEGLVFVALKVEPEDHREKFRLTLANS